MADTKNGSRDFDFLHGSWTVHNRYLVKRLAGATEWREYEATAQCHAFGPNGNVDEIVFPTHQGMTVRLYDPGAGTWALYWADSRYSTIEAPTVGRFVDGVGHFYSDDLFEGRKVRCRYLWSRITPTSARWEQALSVDGEQTWETNWIMDFTRVE
jgi:hypothetical protein